MPGCVGSIKCVVNKKSEYADSLWHGSLALYMTKLDKNNAPDGLILDHEVLQNCSSFLQVDFGHGLDSKIELEEGSIPTYHYTISWGARGIRTVA